MDDSIARILDDVKEADGHSMPNADTWLDPPILDAMVFANTAELWDTIKGEFHGRFKEMVYGNEMPNDDDVLRAVKTIKDGIANA